MPLAQGSAAVALVAVVVTILGIFERRCAFQAQQAELVPPDEPIYPD